MPADKALRPPGEP